MKIIILIPLLFLFSGCSTTNVPINEKEEPVVSISNQDNEVITEINTINTEKLTFTFDNLDNELWTTVYLDNELFLDAIKANEMTYTVEKKEDTKGIFTLGERKLDILYFKDKKNIPQKINKKDEKKSYQIKYTIVQD